MYWMKPLRLDSQWVQWIACTPCWVNTLRNGLRYRFDSRSPQLDHVYHTMLSRVRLLFWHWCRIACLMTISAKSAVPHDEIDTALKGSASKEWVYVKDWDIIASFWCLVHICGNHYCRWVITGVWLFSTVYKDSSLICRYSTILGLMGLWRTNCRQ